MEPRYDVNVPRQMASMTGYEFITSFWDDFVIAERMGCGVQDGHLVPTDVETGVKAIEDTFDRAFREWKSNYKYLTELVMVLNWKIWRFNGIIEDYCIINSGVLLMSMPYPILRERSVPTSMK